MPLDPGDKLAHDEILEPIGRGGMSEVYRAKDSKLGRDVAIKVLPDELTWDEERLRPFQREAKASCPKTRMAVRYKPSRADALGRTEP